MVRARHLIALLTLSLTVLLSVPGGTGTASAAPRPQSPQSDFNATVQQVQRHVETDAQGNRRFNSAAAEAAGVSPEALAAGAEFNRIAPAYGPIVRPNSTTAPMDGFPVWGNWCGPGHGSGTPIDTLDTLCMRHDKCYGQRGYFDCYCDAQLKAEIGRFSGRMGWRERAVAAAITVWFSVTPCVPH